MQISYKMVSNAHERQLTVPFKLFPQLGPPHISYAYGDKVNSGATICSWPARD